MSSLALSIVAPVYNEQKCLPEFWRRLDAVIRQLDLNAEIILINDGSEDESLQILRELRRKDSRIKILNFSRNFGHQVAVKAGIDYAQGDAVIIMDTDLQDPPEVIPDFLAKCKEGYDVVYAVRTSREGESLFKKWTASFYYRMIKKITPIDMPLDAGDFRLITGQVTEAIRGIKERHPYIRGLISWVGFRQTGIPIHREARYSGQTKYSLRKMFQLAWNGVTHFSFLPLQISTFMGFLTSAACLLWVLWTLYVSLILRIAVPGWTSLMIAVLFLGSIQLITLGIIGSYLARNYDESRSRPLYILKDKEGF